MRILRKLKRPVICASMVGCIVCVLVPSAFSQIVERSTWRQDFISRDYRPRWGEEYENFGNYDYRRYPRIRYDYVSVNIDKGVAAVVPSIPAQPVRRGPVTPVTYDQFGNFLLPGLEIYSFNWNKSRLGAYETTDSNWMTSIFNNLVVLSDDFSNWETKFMVSTGTNNGQGLRAYFTPSTLKDSNFSGIRWDASSRKNNVSLVVSQSQLGESQKPLYGIHWQSVLGDVLKVGATYVHKQRGTLDNSQRDIDELIRSEPRYVYLVVTDDSPEDTGAGARVYNVTASLNGKQEPIAFHGENYPIQGRMFKIPNIVQAHHYAGGGFSAGYMFPYDNSSEPETDGSDYYHKVEEYRNNYGSWFLDLIDQQALRNDQNSQTFGRNDSIERLFSKTTTGQLGLINVGAEDVTGNANDRWDPSVPGDVQRLRYYKADQSAGYVEAQGTDVIIYEFLIPSGVRELSFNVQAANDYCIDIIAALYRRQQEVGVDWNDLTTGTWNVFYDLKHCVKAPGNVKDSSNLKWVKVTYDRVVSSDVYGMNMELDWNGLFVRAEYNLNTVRRSLPVAVQIPDKGKINSRTERAWFVNVEKEIGDKASVGGEFFDYPMDFQNYWSTVEDNDDNNRYKGVYDGNRISGGVDGNGLLSGAYRDIPGLNSDFDLYIDDAWSSSLYIGYYYDSIRFGDDFNHNGIIDYREDDTKIDLPYDRDSYGQHYFIKYHPTDNTLVTFGHYDVRQTEFDGRNFSRYLKVEHFQPLGTFGEMLFWSRTERVQDNYKLTPIWDSANGNNSDPVSHHYDIDDWRTNNFIQSRLTFIPNVNIINNAQFSTYYEMGSLYRPNERSYDEQIMDYLQTHYDGEETTRYGRYSYALEHKADYTLRIADARLIPEVSFAGIRLWKEKRVRELRITPAVKFVHRYNIYPDSNWYLYSRDQRERIIDFYPVFRVDYRVSPQSMLRFAVQGIPGLQQMHRRSSEKITDYDQRNMILALENRTLYQGFNLLLTMGVTSTKREYIHDSGRIVDTDQYNTRYFITMQTEAGR